MKIAPRNFTEPKNTSSNGLFCLINSSKPKNILFTIITDKEKQQIFTFGKLEQAHV